MRNYRISFAFNSAEAALWYRNEVLDVDFCDVTHWFCGLDGEGEDTPDVCVIYEGAFNSNVLYLEVDIDAVFGKKIEETIAELKKTYVPCKFSDGFELLEVKFTELKGGE